MTSVLPETTHVLASPRRALWRDEGGASMRSLGYFIGAFTLALVLGIGSAWYMIERGSPLTTEKAGPWESWISEGNPNADPYTKAHLARSGRLPLTSTAARYFVAHTDDQGSSLTSSCEYSVVGMPLNARWWSLALYDGFGALIDNPSDRYSFNSEEAIRRSDGTFHVTISRNARPENWLPSGTEYGRGLTLMLRVYGPRDTDVLGIGQIPVERLPKIERVICE
ncbi:MAG: DUF1214 domain-containing protein [Alphaproteobacteria bacterium]|nr:DUF1214 domain-containing protein [Alphaproteobacteria bacterium]